MFTGILKMTLGFSLKLIFNAHCEDARVFKTVKPPYFLISNHNSFWGPFLLAFFVPAPVSFVVSDANFRSPIMNLLLSLIGSIPKTKVLSDLDTIKYIMDIRKKRGVIGLFPEGQNSYDGHTQPIFYSTAKLLKSFKIPVIFGYKRGTYLSFPRWAKRKRRGKVLISYRSAFTPKDLIELTVPEIYEKLENMLEYNEFDFQKEHHIAFKGKDLAEYLEIVLFVCPNCRSIATLSSKHDTLSCSHCGYRVTYTEEGFFETESGVSEYTTIREWNVWQLSYIESTFKERLLSEDNAELIRDRNIRLFTGYKTEPMKRFGGGELILYKDSMVFASEDKKDLVFSLEKMEGVNMHNNEKLEFYYQDTLFRFDSEDSRKSLYKWYCFITTLQKLKETDNTVVGS